MERRLAISLGRVADWERNHLGEGAFGYYGTSGEEAFGVIGIRAPRRIGKGGIWGERCPGTRVESRPGVLEPIHCPRPAGFKALSHRGPLYGLFVLQNLLVNLNQNNRL